MTEEINAFRKKYPGYGDLDDFTLAKMLANKFPEYADLPEKVRVEMTGGMSSQPIPGTGETKIRTSPPAWQESVSSAGEIAALGYGAVKGAAAGTAVLGPGPGTIIGGMAGAGTAYAGVRQAKRAALELQGYREPQPTGEAAVSTLYDVAAGGVMEGGGQIVSKVAGKLIAPFAEYLQTPKGSEVLSIFKQYGINPTAGQIKPGSKTFGIVESVLGYRPFSGDVMVKKSMEQIDILNNVREQLIAKGAPSDTLEIIGNKIQKELSTVFERHGIKKANELTSLVDTAMNRLGTKITKHEAGAVWSTTMDEGKDKIAQHVRNSYTRVSESMPKQGNVEVPQTSTESVAEEIFKEQKGVRTQVPSVIQTVGKYRAKPELSPADLKRLENMGLSEDMLIKDPELMDLFMGKKAKIKPTWNSMDKEQSILNDRIVAIRAAHGGKDTTATHYLGRLRGAILEDMEVYAKQQGSSTWNLYLKAKAASKFQHDVFNKDILKIMGKNPEDIVDSVIRKGKDSTTYLRQVHMATGDAGIEPLKSVSSARLFENSRKTGVLGDVIDPTLLKKNWDNIPVDTRDMLFSKAEQSLVDNVIQKGQKIAYQMKGAKTSQFINRIVNAEPQSVVDMILEAKAESNAHIARKVLPKARLDEVRSKLMERILKMSGEGKLLVSASNKEFQKYDPVLRELMREPGGSLPQRYFGLKRFLSLEENMKRASQLAVNASQTGQVLLGSQLASSVLRAGAGAVVGGATSGPGERGGGALTGAAASLALPWVIAKIYTSDAASRYFTRAISMNPGSKQAIELFTKAILALGRPESEQQPNVAKE